MRRQQSGFTIIELVVVIILLGIMAATALPRFMDVTTEAHASKVQGVQGGLASGSALFHAQWVAKGQLAAGSDIGWDNTLLTNATGYPCGTACTTVVDAVADCTAIFSNLLQAGAPSLGEAANVAGVVAQTNDFTVVLNGTTCDYYYTGEKSASADVVPLLSYASATGDLARTDPTLP
ncbi:MAG: MSHA pilin protein MshB [Cyclobacteriaceae bacterium]|jgi:MSHA pilin protein MshB